MRKGKGQSPPPSRGARKQDPKRKEGTRRPQQPGSQEFLEGGWLITHTGRIHRGVPCGPGGAGGGGARLWTRSEVAGRTLRTGGPQEELRTMAKQWLKAWPRSLPEV